MGFMLGCSPDFIELESNDGGASDTINEENLDGWIGGDCMAEDDCLYDEAVCVTSRPEMGTCSQQCDVFCPDIDGEPVTFCTDIERLQDVYELSEALESEAALCLARCDTSFYENECPEDYRCIMTQRQSEPHFARSACVPEVWLGEQKPISSCQNELRMRSISFEVLADWTTPLNEDAANDCYVDEAIALFSPVNGIEVVDGLERPVEHLIASCALATSISDMFADLSSRGVRKLITFGTYNCRTIAGTSTMSNHGRGLAIDIAGFELEDGTVITLSNDWERPGEEQTSSAVFLNALSTYWWEESIWDTILTPAFDAAHADHFHVDLTEDGSRFFK